jgi:DNA-binding CsgD family transcriptional regulator/PAS domain-containing protein
MSVLLHKDAASTSIVTILRGERDTPFDGQAVRFLRAMAPHLRRAVQIHRRIHSVEREAATASDVLDALPVAVLVVDTDAKVVLANRRGRALLAASDGLSVDRGRLSAARPDDTRRLRGLCAAVTATRVTAPRHPGGAMRLGRPSGRPALEALVTPSPPTAPLGAAGEPTTALVFVNDPSEQPLPDKARLQRYYRLTPAESDVAHRLAAGFSLEQIAEQRGTAIATVQHQNKQILAKTGARHRTGLLRQLSALWPPLAGESRRE